MPKESYESLTAHIQEQELALEDARRATRAAEHQLKGVQAVADKRLIHVKTMQTLNLGIFSGLDDADIYKLATQSAVMQLKWDSAFVLSFQGSRGELKAAYQATELQVQHIKDYLDSNEVIRGAYGQHIALNTYNSTDSAALNLRSFFHTDEVVAMPILFGDQFYGYIVVCAHTKRNDARGPEDVEFVATLASQVAHAVQNTTSFSTLEQQNAKLRQLDELKNSFISITSHQLRTPLSIIKWILSILQGDEKIKDMPEQYKLIEQAYVSNERLIHVVNDLLNVSRIQEGKLPHNPQLTDIHIILRDLISGAERLAESKQVTIMAHIDAPLPNLQLDPILFKEALQNVIDNGIDYNRENGWVRIELSQENESVVVKITNTGEGIAAEEISSIFNQFFRSQSAVKLHPNGNGLGLYLTKAIIQQHKGEITCQSELGKDTTFTITLPITV